MDLEWAKNKSLKIDSSFEITKVLKDNFEFNKDDKNMCRNKKIKIALKDKTILLKKEHVLLSYDWKLGANKVQELILKNS